MHLKNIWVFAPFGRGRFLIEFMASYDGKEVDNDEVKGEVLLLAAVCHELESGTIKDPPCREAMHDKYVESSNVLPLVWWGC
ncbi:hypothetical protein TNCV_3644631 [Trichonephila clavipes]|nr:hypothetical protein TNCV_3644631 [Trichonephila clavipes]